MLKTRVGYFIGKKTLFFRRKKREFESFSLSIYTIYKMFSSTLKEPIIEKTPWKLLQRVY